MPVPTFTKTGTKAATAAKLNKSVFGGDVINHELLKQAYLAYLANGRTNLAQTKTRGLVRGGGRKPWRQKGTGRARFGSSRNPIWRGGGITFGPTGEENYKINLNVKAKRNAIRQALSLAEKANKFIVVEAIEAKEAKTKILASLLKKVGAEGSVLMVVDKKTPELLKSSANIANVKVLSAKYLNVYDVLNADKIVLSSEALKIVTDWLAKEGK